jgi:hypothetical protein
MEREQRDQVLRDNWEGHNYKELAKLVNWNPESVRKWGTRNKMSHKKQNVQTKPRRGVIDLGKLKALIKKNRLSVVEVADYFDVAPATAKEAIKQLQAGHTVLEVIDDKVSLGSDLRTTDSPFVIDNKKHKEVTFGVGFTADNHLCSKYERMDILNSLFDRFLSLGVADVYQGGNMIDGEARFNKFDIHKHGVEDQVAYFVEKWPQRDGITTHFVTGDDHEGWYVQREHINIGQKIEDEAIRAGRHDLHHLGYMERDIEFTQPGGSSRVRIIHAGGGSSYATSYTSQKYVESLQGGEKPSVVLVGHFHKLDYAYPREVHVIQMGCTEDQTPFMRKKRLQAHLGGGILWLTQNDLGIFTSVKVEFFTFYDKKFYEYKW